MRALIDQMRDYCRHGAKALGPLLDPADGRSSPGLHKQMCKSRRAAGWGLIASTEAAQGDPEALAIIAAIRAHPKPQHVIGLLQDAYSAPRWDLKPGQVEVTGEPEDDER